MDTNNSIVSLPQNLSLSGLESSIFLVNGERIEIKSFDFSDEQMNVLAADTKVRSRIVLREIFVLGHNLLLAKQKFVEDFGGDDKEFLKIMSEKTDTPIAELKKRISVAENYSIQDIELLMEKGVSITAAAKLSKLPAAREELLAVAKEFQGKVSPKIIDEISQGVDFSTGEEESEELIKASVKSGGSGERTKKLVQPEPEPMYSSNNEGETTTVYYGEEATTKFYESIEKTPENKNCVSELQQAKTQIDRVLRMIHHLQVKYDFNSRAGQVARASTATMFAGFYDIPIPSTEFIEGEEDWITQLRLKISKTGTAEICSNYLIGFVEGWVSFIEESYEWANFLEVNPKKPDRKLIPPPLDYDSLTETGILVKKGVIKMKEFYDIGYNMAKERNA